MPEGNLAGNVARTGGPTCCLCASTYLSKRERMKTYADGDGEEKTHKVGGAVIKRFERARASIIRSLPICTKFGSFFIQPLTFLNSIISLF